MRERDQLVRFTSGTKSESVGRHVYKWSFCIALFLLLGHSVHVPVRVVDPISRINSIYGYMRYSFHVIMCFTGMLSILHRTTNACKLYFSSRMMRMDGSRWTSKINGFFSYVASTFPTPQIPHSDLLIWSVQSVGTLVQSFVLFSPAAEVYILICCSCSVIGVIVRT